MAKQLKGGQQFFKFAASAAIQVRIAVIPNVSTMDVFIMVTPLITREQAKNSISQCFEACYTHVSIR